MAASVVAFDVAVRVTPAFRLHASVSRGELLADLEATRHRADRVAAETRALLARIAELEAASLAGRSTAAAFDAVSTQAHRVRALTS
jgi:hypothetical protein